MPKKARKPPTEIRKQDICKKRRGNLPQKSESRTYAKKGEETSHRNPKAGHMQKKGEGTSHRNPKTGHNQKENLHMSQQKENVGHSQKKICICPNKRKMWDIVKRKSAYVPTKGKCGT